MKCIYSIGSKRQREGNRMFGDISGIMRTNNNVSI
jgi:hypothetical protein